MKGDIIEKLENRVISAICYFVSVTPLILIATVLIVKLKSSDYVKFHVNQGLILYVVTFIIAIFINVILDLPSIFNTLLYIVTVSIIIWGTINALIGKTKEIPVIGKIHLIKSSYQVM